MNWEWESNFSESKNWLWHNFCKFLLRQLILTTLGNIILERMDIGLIQCCMHLALEKLNVKKKYMLALLCILSVKWWLLII